MRGVEALVQAVGGSGVSKSDVSRLCAELDERVQAFLSRPLEGEWPYLRLDAEYVKARRDHGTVAVAVNTGGRAKCWVLMPLRGMLGATWQHCRFPPPALAFMRNAMARAGKS